MENLVCKKVYSLFISYRYIPVAVVGSVALLDRIKYQEQECKQHEMRLKVN